MSRMATFDYYYGMQAEAYSFYRIPKILFTDPFFKTLSCEAKVPDGNPVDLYSCSQHGIGHIYAGRWSLHHNRYPELPDGA